MHYSNLLLTIAEISGVLVGFANLASVFEKSNEDEARQINKIRLLIITEGGIVAIFASLLPFLLSAFSDSEIFVFRIAALTIIPLATLNIIFNFRRGRRITGIPLKVQMWGLPTTKKVGVIIIPISLFILVPLLLIAAGYFDSGPIAGMYCLSLMASFLTMFMFLIRFLRQVIA